MPDRPASNRKRTFHAAAEGGNAKYDVFSTYTAEQRRLLGPLLLETQQKLVSHGVKSCCPAELHALFTDYPFPEVRALTSVAATE